MSVRGNIDWSHGALLCGDGVSCQEGIDDMTQQCIVVGRVPIWPCMCVSGVLPRGSFRSPQGRTKESFGPRLGASQNSQIYTAKHYSHQSFFPNMCELTMRAIHGTRDQDHRDSKCSLFFIDKS